MIRAYSPAACTFIILQKKRKLVIISNFRKPVASVRIRLYYYLYYLCYRSSPVACAKWNCMQCKRWVAFRYFFYLLSFMQRNVPYIYSWSIPKWQTHQLDGSSRWFIFYFSNLKRFPFFFSRIRIKLVCAFFHLGMRAFCMIIHNYVVYIAINQDRSF